MKKIRMTFDKRTGEVRIEAEGFRGSTCKDATKFLADALGETTEFKKKAEWFEENVELPTVMRTNLCG